MNKINNSFEFLKSLKSVVITVPAKLLEYF